MTNLEPQGTSIPKHELRPGTYLSLLPGAGRYDWQVECFRILPNGTMTEAPGAKKMRPSGKAEATSNLKYLLISAMIYSMFEGYEELEAKRKRLAALPVPSAEAQNA